MSWHKIAKKITKKWRRDGILPRPNIGHYMNYMFDHISYIDGLGFYVSSQIENRHVPLDEVAKGQFGPTEFKDTNTIITEIWPDLSEEEKTMFMTSVLCSNA